MTRDDLAAALALCDAATPGPWLLETDPRGAEYGYSVTNGCISPRLVIYQRGPWEDRAIEAKANAALALAARTLLPQALLDLRAAMDDADRLKAFCHWLFDQAVLSGCDVDGGSIQERLLTLGLVERRKAEPGSPEAEEWGEDVELYFWRDAAPVVNVEADHWKADADRVAEALSLCSAQLFKAAQYRAYGAVGPLDEPATNDGIRLAEMALLDHAALAAHQSGRGEGDAA